MGNERTVTGKVVSVQEICEMLDSCGYKLIKVCPEPERWEDSGLPFGDGKVEEDEFCEMLRRERERSMVLEQQRKFEEEVDNPKLVAALKEWRYQKAKEENVPAYIVLGNMVLLRIAGHVPSNMDELLEIKGFGPAKAEKYGKDILDIVANNMEVEDVPF